MERENTEGNPRGSYFVVCDYMVSDLKLKGAERDVFAVISGFNDDKGFYGSLKYLSRLTGYTDRSVLEALNQLTAKGYIAKRIDKVKGVRRCFYSVPKNFQYRKNFSTEKISPEPPKLFHPTTEIISPPLHYIQKIKKGDRIGETETPPNNNDNGEERFSFEDYLASEETQQPTGEQLTLDGNPAISARPFSAKDFVQLWHKWIDKNGLQVEKARLTEERRRKFEARQKAFAKDGANGQEFWQRLLACIVEARDGLYIGNGTPQAGHSRPWKITFDWLVKNDTNIAKLLEAQTGGGEEWTKI